VTSRAADDLLRDAATFVSLVETTVGVLPHVTAGSPADPYCRAL